MAPVVKRDRGPGKKWSKAEALDWHRRATEKLGRTPKNEEMIPYVGSFTKLFGSIPAFHLAAGHEPRPQGRPRKPSK